MTLISAYIELFIRGEKSGGNVRRKCPDTNENASVLAALVGIYLVSLLQKMIVVLSGKILIYNTITVSDRQTSKEGERKRKS